MAHNRKMAIQTDIIGSNNMADTARLRKAEETAPAEWWKERHKKKGDMTMNRYEVDPNKEKKLLHRFAGHMGRTDTDTEASRALNSEQEARNGGETQKQNTNQNRTEDSPKGSHA